MPRVVHVVPVVNVRHVNVVSFVPARCPVLRPGVDNSDPAAVVFESWTSGYNQDRKGMDAESMLRAEINDVTLMRDAIAVITAALFPIVMFMRPLMCATLLPNHAVFRARPNMPRLARGSPHHVLFVAWRYMPRTLLDMLSSL